MMHATMLAYVSLLAGLHAPPPAAGAESRQGRPTQVEGMPAVPQTPASVTELLEVTPFVLDRGYVHEMRKERPEVMRGHVLVLRCAPAYLLRRQAAEPVLVAGLQTVERINIGYESGVLVALVPEWTEKGADGVERAGEPAAARMYFATPELPERVDAGWIAAETEKARMAAIAPAPVAASARGEERRFADRDALNRFLADLVERHAPAERACARSLRGLAPE